jgi:nucleoside 2-deoxyribosyltransferase
MKNCFVVMPFRAELRYMYLFIKQHVEVTFPGVSCERGDDKILTRPILEKVADYIKQADVVIADCSGRNPNVFYELGMAHALDKPVVLITADEVVEAPSDIRAFEFIKYTEDERAFAEKLDKALSQILGNPFDELYQRASVFFEEFKNSKHLVLAKVTKDEFMADAAIRVRTSGIPRLEDESAIATLFLPLMVQGPADLDVLGKMMEWIRQKFGQ